MFEREAPSVQERPLERREHPVVGREAAPHPAVEGVARDGVADACQMHADLVGAAGGDGDGGQGQAAQPLGARDPGDGRAGAAGPRRYLPPVDGVAAERRVDAAPGVQQAPRQPQVRLVDLAVRELPGQPGVGRVVLGDHHQSRRAAVEAVHDAGPLLAADAAEPGDVVQQGVHQGAPVVAGGGVDHHARRLVDHRDVGVVVQDDQRQRFRGRRRRCRRRNLQVDHVAGAHGPARPDRPPVQERAALPNQALNLRPRSLRHDRRHEVIEARAVVRLGDLQALGVRGGRRRPARGAVRGGSPRGVRPLRPARLRRWSGRTRRFTDHRSRDAGRGSSAAGGASRLAGAYKPIQDDAGRGSPAGGRRGVHRGAPRAAPSRGPEAPRRPRRTSMTRLAGTIRADTNCEVGRASKTMPRGSPR